MLVVLVSAMASFTMETALAIEASVPLKLILFVLNLNGEWCCLLLLRKLRLIGRQRTWHTFACTCQRADERLGWPFHLISRYTVALSSSSTCASLLFGHIL